MAVQRSAALLAAVVGAVVVALGAAFLVLDSPIEERRQRLDDQREHDLSRIAAGVDKFWEERGTLPASLDELRVDQNWQGVPSDPVSDEPYAYRATGEATYQLCAEFATESTADDHEDRSHAFRLRRIRAIFETHPAGAHCFELDAPDSE